MNLTQAQKQSLYYLYLWDLIFETPRAEILLDKGYFIEDFDKLVEFGLATKQEMFDMNDLGGQKEMMLDSLSGVQELNAIDVSVLKNSGKIYGYQLTQSGKLMANKEIPLAKKIDALALKPKVLMQQNKTKETILRKFLDK